MTRSRMNGSRQRTRTLSRRSSRTATIEQIQDYRHGGDRTTIKRHLKALREVGLVRCDELGRWYAVAEVDLDLVAESIGVAGAAEKQRRRHQIDRELFGSGPRPSRLMRRAVGVIPTRMTDGTVKIVHVSPEEFIAFGLACDNAAQGSRRDERAARSLQPHLATGIEEPVPDRTVRLQRTDGA